MWAWSCHWLVRVAHCPLTGPAMLDPKVTLAQGAGWGWISWMRGLGVGSGLLPSSGAGGVHGDLPGRDGTSLRKLAFSAVPVSPDWALVDLFVPGCGWDIGWFDMCPSFPAEELMGHPQAVMAAVPHILQGL